MARENQASGGGTNRRHTTEFKIEIAQRMLAGESSAALSRQHGIARSMMYRWRNAYRDEGPAGLRKQSGRPPRNGLSPSGELSKASTTEQQLRRQIAELERQLGRKAVENEFLRRVFKRVSELPKAQPRGGKASTPKSGG